MTEPHKTIKSDSDLVTTLGETKAGFILMALEKNSLAKPYIDKAKVLDYKLNEIERPEDVISVKQLHKYLLPASGISKKASKYMDDDDLAYAFKEFVTEFLVPEGQNFRQEFVYRYLLTMGDALGGSARNLAGALAERKIIDKIFEFVLFNDLRCSVYNRKKGSWSNPDVAIEHSQKPKALHWVNKSNQNRVLLLNINVPFIGDNGKNVDFVLLNSDKNTVGLPKKSDIPIYKQNPSCYLAMGELKGGIDPAGADEHWKTASKALLRIKESFDELNADVDLFFVAAAIQKSMAKEIYDMLNDNELAAAANLHHDIQLHALCDWLVNI